MKTTVSIYDFYKAFEECRPNNFTREGLTLLFDGLEEFEEDTGEEMELDVIAICCDFAEMTEEEIARSYNVDLTESSKDMWDWLGNKTWVLGKTETGNYVFRQF